MLPYERKKEFYELLVENEYIKLHKMIDEMQTPAKKFLLDGLFCFENEFSFACPVMKRMCRPLLIAVMTGSTEAIELLITESADVFQENSYKENMFHS